MFRFFHTFLESCRDKLPSRIKTPFDRDAFMEAFREEDSLSNLTVDDRIEIFLDVLVGSSDITLELLKELCHRYSADWPWKYDYPCPLCGKQECDHEEPFHVLSPDGAIFSRAWTIEEADAIANYQEEKLGVEIGSHFRVVTSQGEQVY